MIYLDNAATTRPIGKLSNEWFNTHSPYSNSNIIRKSKEIISDYLGCKWNEIIFGYSGSWCNNVCIKVLYNKYGKVGIKGVEHKSVLDNQYTTIDNIVDYGMVNNETGEIINGSKGYDLVQGIGKLSRDNIKDMILEVACGSGHKIHSYKGLGWCYIREDLQEYMDIGYMGTEWSDGVWHMANRFDYIMRNENEILEKNRVLKDRLLYCLSNSNLDYKINAINGCICSLNTGMNNNYVINRLAEENIYVSAGSACTTGEPSHVLKYMGLTDDEINNTIRISWDSIENDPDYYDHMDDLVWWLEKIKKDY